ncbi:MAG: hypothetical protein Q9169_000733 [Polycauliona sp. 2 TL-2023]
METEAYGKLATHSSYSKYEHLLSPGWIPGRKVDNSDQQYSGFRGNIPYMFLLLMFHPILRRTYDYFGLADRQAASPSQNDLSADLRLGQRVRFDVGFACLYLVALHGTSALKVVAILFINFSLAKKLPKSYLPLATWVFNIGVLFANEWGRGYPYVEIARLLSPWSSTSAMSAGEKTGQNWGTHLDNHSGLLPRWEILFNITVLRLISFNLDYYWSSDRVRGSALEKKQLDPSNLSERDRVDLPAKTEDYSFRNYFAYVLYSPLYLTGPIVTFNEYISQVRYTPRSITRERTMLYGIRFLISLLTMEVMLHFLYVVAISKSQPTWEIYTPFQLSMLGYFNLHIIWLKLLLPWRFFRLWALLDGIDPPENMVRCMSDNYSAMAFWRGWHRSFNRWIVRYIYIPLGGSGASLGSWGKAQAVFNMLIVFTFVALWHDIQLKLLIWGWLVTLFVLPEVLAGYLFPKSQWLGHRDAYRLICGVGAVGNILMMMAANLVGFAVGLDGVTGLVRGIVGSYSGLVFLTAASGALFAAAQIMFELREHELRYGIKLKLTHPSDHIWISDDILNHAISRYMQLHVGRRHGSAVPGPLEARKRAAKRRVMGLAPTLGGLDPHPAFIAGLGRGQENQQSWQWQSPNLPQSKHPPRLGDSGEYCPDGHADPHPADNPALPAWLTDYEPNDESVTAEENQKPEVVGQVDTSEVIPGLPCHKKPKIQDHDSLEARLRESIELDDLRILIGSMAKHDRLRKTASRLALRQMLDTRCDMDKILGFWVDPLLNPWGAGNLPFFVSYCAEGSRSEEMGRFCDWMVRQFYVGACSDRNVLVLTTELSRFKDRDNWQEMLASLCQSIAQALRSSPVLRTEDISFKTYSGLLAILFEDIYASSRLELGLDLVKASSSAQLKDLADLVRPIIEHWVDTWEPSRSADLGLTKLSSTITSLLNAMPHDELLEIVRDVSWHFLNLSLFKSSSRDLWRKRSLWWSAIRALEIFGHIKKTSLWSEISKSLRKRQEEAIDSMALVKINENLSQHKLQAAYRKFLQCPRIALERCPDLAEDLILDPGRNWRTALMLRESRQAILLANQHSTGDDCMAKHLQQDRVRLLERMALAYAQQDHIPVAMVFYYVYGCWKIHERDKLGPMGPAMLHAIILCGIVRPLEAHRQVSRTRLEWILRMAAEVEGVNASTRLGATIHEWLNEGYRQARLGRAEVLHQSLSQRHHEQSSQVPGTDPWDWPTVTAQGQSVAPSRHGPYTQAVSRTSPVIDMYSAAIANGKERVDSHQTYHFSPKNQEDGRAGQPAKEMFMSAQATATAASVESSSSNSTAVDTDGERQYIDAVESNPSAASFEELHYSNERIKHDASWDREAISKRNGLGCAAYIHPDLPPETKIRQQDVQRKRTRKEAFEQWVIDRRVQALLFRLNASRIAGVNNTTTSEYSNGSAYLLYLPELSSIPPCSLALSAMSPSPAQKEQVDIWRKRILGSRDRKPALLRHGMREYKGPITFRNVKEPAIGAGLLHAPWLLEAVGTGEKRLDLAFRHRGRAHGQSGNGSMVHRNTWRDRDG